MQGAHIVQAVGQLHQNHPDIAGHGEHHLAQVFCLLLGLRFEFDLGDFRYAVNQFGHFRAELGSKLFFANATVLKYVMQHCRHQTLVIHVHVDQDIGDRQGMADVRVAAAPVLALMGALGKLVGTHNPGDLIVVQITFQPFNEIVNGGQAAPSGFVCQP